MVSTLDESEHVYAVRMMKKAMMAHIATWASLKHMPQSELADLLDLDQPTISRLCNGHDEIFSLNHLCRICRTLGFGIHLQFYPVDPRDG